MDGIGVRILNGYPKTHVLLEVVGAVLDRICKFSSLDRFGSWEIEISPVEINLTGLAKEFDGFQIVQISDFHFGSWVNKAFLEKAVDLVNQRDPDLVVITGDFVSFFPEKYYEDLLVCLKELRPKHQVFAVLGNHDHWSDAAVVRQVLSQCIIRELDNQVLTLTRGIEKLYIGGVDDHLCKMDRLEKVTGQIPEDGVAILLAHEPDFADISSLTGRFKLQLSGHSHGGQINFPIISRFFLPSQGKKYPSGRYQVGDMVLYTSRGLGTSWLNLRINCPPEITIITLKSA